MHTDREATPWEELPYVNGEDGAVWNNLMARYQHRGCPGLRMEDICFYSAPECAAKGMCRLAYEKSTIERTR
jgi:hypothetical protein